MGAFSFCISALCLLAIGGNVALAGAGPLPLDCSSENLDAEVLVLGAGAAGLSAGRTLAQSGRDDFLYIELREIIGGRMQTAPFGGDHVELGPQWVLYLDFDAPEEIRNPLVPLVQRCNIQLRPEALGDLPTTIYTRDGKNITEDPEVGLAFLRYFLATEGVAEVSAQLPDELDIPSSAGLRLAGWRPMNAVDEWVEWLSFDFPLARPSDTSSFKETLGRSIDPPSQFGNNTSIYIVTDPRGYHSISECLAEEFLSPNDSRLIFNTVVRTVQWSDECVCVDAEYSGEFRRYCGSYAILTFSIGELQDGGVEFVPELPLKKVQAIHQPEMGNFLKVYLEFNETFWDTNVDFIGYIDDTRGREYYPAFFPWGYYLDSRAHILEAYLIGDEAWRVSRQDPEITKEQIAEVLRNIYGERASYPIDIIMGDFIVNPYFLGNLMTTIPGVTASTYKELDHPLGRLYFAGDGNHPIHHSSVNGAIISGENTAKMILRNMEAPPQVTFINDSPRVEGDTISGEFVVSEPVALLDCIILQRRMDCSSGQFLFANLTSGTYTLKVVASNGRGDRSVERRTLVVSSEPYCAAHLINSGVSVRGNRATIEFTTTDEPAISFSCTVDNERTFPCKSPLVLKELKKGGHRVIIRPQCEGEVQQERLVVRFNIDTDE